MLLHFIGESPCLSKLLEISTAVGSNFLSLQMQWAQTTGKWIPHRRSSSPRWCCPVLPTNAAVRFMVLQANDKIQKATHVVKPRALEVQCCVEAGYCNSDWQNSVTAALVTQPRVQSWGCFGAFWYTVHFDVFKNARQVSPLRIFCRVFGIYVNINSCSKMLHTLAVHYVKKCLPFFSVSFYLNLTICRSFIGRNTEQLFPTHYLLSPIIWQVYFIIWCVLQPEGFYAIFITFSSINSSVIYLPISVISKHLSAAGNVLALKLGLYGCNSAKRASSP